MSFPSPARASQPSTRNHSPDPNQMSTDETMGQAWINDNFISAQVGSLEVFSAKLDRVLQIGLDFKANPKVVQQPQAVPASKSFEDAPRHGVSFDGLLETFAALSKQSTNWASPNFVGFPDSGNSLPAMSAAIVVPLLNQNLANQEICSPAATFIEMELVHWLRALLGYPVASEYASSRGIGGTLTLGGCLSDTVALLAAREKCFPNSRLHGIPVPAQEVVVLVPDIIEHYSIRSAMSWLGLGEKQVVRVTVDSAFRMKIDALRECIETQRARGKYIMACCAYAGDSRTMRIDNLADRSSCLQEYNIWFHVDACHGFQLAFSETHKSKLNGIERADSVTIDPHKVMWTPTTCSLVLFRNPEDLSNVSTSSDLILNTQWSLGKITPFIGSKSFDALKLWSVIKYFGVSRIGQLIDSRIAMTRNIQRAVQDKEDLVLLNDTDINSCIFQFFPQNCQGSKISDLDLAKLNTINERIRADIIARGESYVHGFPLKSLDHPIFPQKRQVYVLRTLNGNALTSMDHIDSLLSAVVTLGRKAIHDLGYCLLQERPLISGLPVIQKLQDCISKTLGSVEHVALVYGSSVCAGKFFFSDIDLMVFVPDQACSDKVCQSMVCGFKAVMQEEGFVLDDEVPLERKLIVPMSVAKKAASSSCQLESGKVITIPRTDEILRSDTMLQRLVFNVLTTPTFCVSGSENIIKQVRQDAERTLSTIAQTLDARAMDTPFNFTRTLISDGQRTGEDYLGYKDQANITEHLHELWSQQRGSP